jgi:hypothetical protein
MTFKGRGLVQITGKNKMSSQSSTTYTMGQMGMAQSMPHVTPIQPLTVSDIGKFTIGGGIRLPNKKISLTIHEATGGYVVTIDKGQYGEEPDMYVIDADKDIGSEIGKIITHHTLSK